RNDDAPPQLTINNVIVTEGDTGVTNAVLTVSLSAPSGLPVSVDWATANGTATVPGDYLAGTGTLSFAAAQFDSKLSTQNQPATIPESATPALRISKSGGYVMISSSLGSLDGFDLQVRDSFSAGSQWT